MGVVNSTLFVIRFSLATRSYELAREPLRLDDDRGFRLLEAGKMLVIENDRCHVCTLDAANYEPRRLAGYFGSQIFYESIQPTIIDDRAFSLTTNYHNQTLDALRRLHFVNRRSVGDASNLDTPQHVEISLSPSLIDLENWAKQKQSRGEASF